MQIFNDSIIIMNSKSDPLLLVYNLLLFSLFYSLYIRSRWGLLLKNRNRSTFFFCSKSRDTIIGYHVLFLIWINKVESQSESEKVISYHYPSTRETICLNTNRAFQTHVYMISCICIGRVHGLLEEKQHQIKKCSMIAKL